MWLLLFGWIISFSMIQMEVLIFLVIIILSFSIRQLKNLLSDVSNTKFACINCRNVHTWLKFVLLDIVTKITTEIKFKLFNKPLLRKVSFKKRKKCHHTLIAQTKTLSVRRSYVIKRMTRKTKSYLNKYKDFSGLICKCKNIQSWLMM